MRCPLGSGNVLGLRLVMSPGKNPWRCTLQPVHLIVCHYTGIKIIPKNVFQHSDGKGIVPIHPGSSTYAHMGLPGSDSQHIPPRPPPLWADPGPPTHTALASVGPAVKETSHPPYSPPHCAPTPAQLPRTGRLSALRF